MTQGLTTATSLLRPDRMGTMYEGFDGIPISPDISITQNESIFDETIGNVKHLSLIKEEDSFDNYLEIVIAKRKTKAVIGDEIPVSEVMTW